MSPGQGGGLRGWKKGGVVTEKGRCGAGRLGKESQGKAGGEGICPKLWGRGTDAIENQ